MTKNEEELKRKAAQIAKEAHKKVPIITDQDRVNKALKAGDDNRFTSESHKSEEVINEIFNNLNDEYGYTISSTEKNIIRKELNRALGEFSGKDLEGKTKIDLQKRLTKSLKDNRYWWSTVKSWFGSKSYSVSASAVKKIAKQEINRLNKENYAKNSHMGGPKHVLPTPNKPGKSHDWDITK